MKAAAEKFVATAEVYQPGRVPFGNPAELLDDVHGFLGDSLRTLRTFVSLAHVLWIGHTHAMDAWESTPRIAFLSPEPGSGKTRALEITETLVPRPVEAVNATPAFLFRRVSDPAGAPTLLLRRDRHALRAEAKDNEEVRGMLNAGHRRGAMAGRCVVRKARRSKRKSCRLLRRALRRPGQPAGHDPFALDRYPHAPARSG